MKQVQIGTTLVELLIILAITTVILSIGFPMVGTTVPKVRAKKAGENLQQVIQFARTSAVLHGHVVTICPWTKALVCGEDWAKGILVYRNPQGTTMPSKEQLLRIVTGYPNEYSLQLKAFGSNFALDFQPGGTATFQNGRFYYHSRLGNIAWQLIINRSGRVRFNRHSAA